METGPHHSITLLSEYEKYRLHCRVTTDTKTFCGLLTSALTYVCTIQGNLPIAYYCPICYSGALRELGIAKEKET